MGKRARRSVALSTIPGTACTPAGTRSNARKRRRKTLFIYAPMLLFTIMHGPSKKEKNNHERTLLTLIHTFI
ncbi:hypothetical protein U0070_015226 [Myodes glareolus]|uniref:Uncharacterized protein n=1 Tax=Myodes glareolus TaxID=447135 RepID=A0AAW0K0Q6_MYOGA